MTIGILGFGHFASVLAVCLRAVGHAVWQWDDDPPIVRTDQRPAVLEPGFARLQGDQPIPQIVGHHGVTLPRADWLWVAYDVPIGPDGEGQDGLVVRRVAHFIRTLTDKPRAIICSSQWRVGQTDGLRRQFPTLDWIYVPENIRAGHAVDDWSLQTRIVIGASWPQPELERLLLPFTTRFERMSPGAAELSKHALNGFLALQIAYANEIGELARHAEVSPQDVMRAVQTDARVSPHAPLKPGLPFGGGSLERDVRTLVALGGGPVIQAILPSNAQHGGAA